MKRILIILLWVSAGVSAQEKTLTFTSPGVNSARDTLLLSLPQVVTMARAGSIASKQASTVRKTKYWEWRTYRSNYQPQLALTGTLPGFMKTTTPVTQPNGTVKFEPIHNNNSTLNLAFSQSITATGGRIYGATELQRFDDFDRNTTLYNAIPYTIGFSQPLFQFNQLKWDKRIEPLRYQESRQQYIADMELIAVKASGYFFDLLLAQVNHQIAEANLRNTRQIQRIADEKFALGKISRNEILQLQLESLKAEKSVGSAKRDMEIASMNLRAYTGLQNAGKIALELPPAVIDMTVQAERVLEEAFANNAESIGYMRRIQEARRDVAKARGETGLNATLNANLGYTNTAPDVSKVYRNPQNQQLVEIGFSIPILDWGRSRSRTKTAEANLEFSQYEVEQDKQNFMQAVTTQVTLFDMMKGQVTLSAHADSIASEKYDIAQNRYVLGDLSITDLSIAFSEKDQAKRDFVLALRGFWGAYYELRYLSLYDFEQNKKITYDTFTEH
ncbi:TolC family protein [Chitinophaga barathri]|uniref:TolC family protein n=1 Tax=Chitinophaga barathri TaxID=1647451 RepID=A0A3N4MRX0_9BACT|nr:TolC family protein [Chitinophaga barathri]RPD42870.1 TolC family protein [Chitinophaga barathri]